LLGILLVSSLLSATYLGQVVYKAYFEKESFAHEEVREVPWIVAPLTISAATSLLLGVYAGPVLELARRVLP
jgi:formate hydrogenlyase subunit 3/multisubunit Na+/H+ antiporter MnhD subunit